MTSDFWTRQRAKLQQEGVIPSPKPSVMASNGPWWADGTNILPQQAQPQSPVQQPTAPVTGPKCPNCGSGGYSKPEPNIAARCFDCGYVDGRTLNEPNIPTGMLGGNAQSIKVKQLPSKPMIGKTMADINANLLMLAQSQHGKAKIG